jgi:hypothetical protein
MLYMSWARYRSIQSPRNYSKELLMKNPCIVIILIWFIGIAIWLPSTLIFGTLDYKTELNFQPPYAKLLMNVIFWFLPLFFILVLSIFIIVKLLKRKNTRSKRNFILARVSLNTGHTSFHNSISFKFKRNMLNMLDSLTLDAKIKFTVIILTFWVQWMPPCFLRILESACDCIPESISIRIYWLTYTVCLTDPIILLILNPNIRLVSNKSLDRRRHLS